ncbi:hypothetical protein IID10_02415, partial [candidate division KSB1 bacterium]|nr:hypothetical protein [candidate division KSB1 bacterium]
MVASKLKEYREKISVLESLLESHLQMNLEEGLSIVAGAFHHYTDRHAIVQAVLADSNIPEWVPSFLQKFARFTDQVYEEDRD